MLDRAYQNPIFATLPEKDQGQHPGLVDIRKITHTGVLKVPTDQINPANGGKKMELYELVSCIGELQALSANNFYTCAQKDHTLIKKESPFFPQNICLTLQELPIEATMVVA